MQDGPLIDPKHRPKNYLHKSVKFSLVKYRIISIQPYRLTQAPSKIWFLSLGLYPCSQELNKLAKLANVI
jgi:hypothetical protein